MMLVLALDVDESILVEDGRGGRMLIKFVGLDISRRARVAIEAPACWDIVRTAILPPGRRPAIVLRHMKRPATGGDHAPLAKHVRKDRNPGDAR